jgi:hypothetical protein
MIPPHTKAISKQKAPFSGPQALEGAFCVFLWKFPPDSVHLGLTGLLGGAIIKSGKDF